MFVVNNILIVANKNKKNVDKLLLDLTKELNNLKINYLVIEPNYYYLETGEILTDFDDKYRHRSYDFIIAIGGDGTFLYTARTFYNFSIPIIGINAGRLGFLMEFSYKRFFKLLEKLKLQSYNIVKRMMLHADVIRDNKVKYSFTFLNDAVISKGTLSRMVEFKVIINNNVLSQYRADGLIVSTPTGSTAYNLASGGPILVPDMEAIIITPICPHILGIRPIVTGVDQNIFINIISKEKNTTLTIDGQENVYLQKDDIIKIKKENIYLNIFDFGEKQFFKALREKLGWHL